MKLYSLFIFSILLLHPATSIADQKTIRLICAYSYTIDETGQSSPTSGESLFTINYSNNGKATIKKQDLGALFSGTVTEEQIYGETNYTFQDIAFHQTLIINRYTGSFELSFGTKKGSIVYFGQCKSAKEKLF